MYEGTVRCEVEYSPSGKGAALRGKLGRRLHSSLAYDSPKVLEQLHHQAQEVGLTPCLRKQGKVKTWRL
jgi:hypothetical protein